MHAERREGPAPRRRPKATRETYSMYVERAAEGADEADGPLSAARRRTRRRGDEKGPQPVPYRRPAYRMPARMKDWTNCRWKSRNARRSGPDVSSVAAVMIDQSTPWSVEANTW